ncbi:MAG: hypothetical protein ABJM43_01305 [Paracoccaceae bacterium]
MLKLYVGLFLFWFSGALAAQTSNPSKVAVYEFDTGMQTYEITCWIFEGLYPTEERANQADNYYARRFVQLMDEETQHHIDAARARGEDFDPGDESTYDKGRTLQLVDNLHEEVQQKYGCEIFTHSSGG